jgi:two-component system chemotaxis sensor kinase CheA
MPPDPYKYFRIESRELLDGLTQGVLQLEKGAGAPDLVQRLLRFAHTLKGAARVVKQADIAERAHAIEDVLTAHRDAGGPLAAPQSTELLRLLDEISACVETLGSVADGKTASPIGAPAEEPLETLRVDIHEMDELLRGITEAAVQLGATHKGIDGVGHIRALVHQLVEQLAARRRSGVAIEESAIAPWRALAEEVGVGLDRLQRSLTTDVERVSSELGEVEEVAHRLRLTAARTVFPSLDRAVRDAAQTLGKRAELELTGGDVRLDAGVLLLLRDALAHVVRNAVAHGIETVGQRGATGKPPIGRLRLDVERQGSRVVFACTDDGRGIDVEAVRGAAVASGRLTRDEAKALSPEAVIALLHAGGLTTAASVTELAGRGIGLDVARATVSRLKGEMRIRSQPHHGTTVELIVPISIASMQGLVVESSGARVAIPLDAVRHTLRVSDGDIARTTGTDSILHRGHPIPFLPLDRALRRARAPGRRRQVWPAVVVQSGDRTIAVGVDRLCGTASIVMRSLPSLVQADPVISGASLDTEGNPQLVLDPRGLVAAADASRGAAPEEPAAERAPILVIDDSLTTRMLEQSILQSAGYEVQLAVSAEDGMEKARERRFSLFIVDVEMPGMDGFEFVTRTRADTALRDIPAILVTSRNAADDRRRGEQAGASAYIVKGEFDQDLLLRTIRRLVG